MKSLDPRVNRLNLDQTQNAETIQNQQCWPIYEVFVQQKQGGQHRHEGSLHAASPEIALVSAKEQFGRRGNCFNIWIVPSASVHALPIEDADMFALNKAKKYRNSNGFKVSDKITQFKKQQAAKTSQEANKKQ